jgi:flagellar biosynthesis anti-sigma factor FlgM
MRIENGQLPGVGTPATSGSQHVNPSGPQQNAASNAVQQGDSTDQVELSGLAGKVASAGADSSERSAKIAELTKLVQSGQYNPSPEKIADAIIQDMTSSPAEE